MHINIPDYIKQIRIDVGLAGEAPNSALWLSETTDRFVIGIEPLERHWKDLHSYTQTDRPYPNFKMLQLDRDAVTLNNEVVCKIDGRFLELHAAIDNIPEPQLRSFYEIEQKGGSSGSSSLLRPTPEHPYKVEKIISVETFSLEDLLNKIDWNRFKYIEHIKTDCEGKDFDAVVSIGKYLDNIVFISSEATSNGQYWYGSQSNLAFENYMINRGFQIIGRGNGNLDFVNPKFNDIIIRDKLTNHTFGA
jgi:hypothetical protein